LAEGHDGKGRVSDDVLFGDWRLELGPMEEEQNYEMTSMSSMAESSLIFEYFASEIF
jgi:hypothetical protein